MNILVTGANGYIGKSLVFSLEKEHVIYKLIHAEEYSKVDNTFSIDLLNDRHLEQLCAENIVIDIIIHTASKMASSDNTDDISVLYDNLKICESLVLITKKFDVNRFINFSSMAVYPNINGNYDEKSLVKPSLNNDALYGLSKFCSENLLDYLLKSKNIKIVHLRIGQVYSEDLRDDRLYKVMIAEILKTNKITVYGNGQRVSNFIHKDSLINKIKIFLNNNFEGVYNVGDENISYESFAKKVISKYGNAKSEIVYKPNGATPKFHLDLNKLQRLETNVKK